MKLFEMIPLILYFVVYKFWEKIVNLLQPYISDELFITFSNTEAFFAAIVVFVPISLAALFVNRIQTGKFDKFGVGVFLVLVILAAPAVIFQNKMLFMWKPTIAFTMIMLAVPVSKIFWNKSLSQTLWMGMSSKTGFTLTAPDTVWKPLDLSIVFVFGFMALLNLYFAYFLSEQMWVNLKVFGLIPFNFGLIVYHLVVLNKYMQHPSDEQVAEEEK